MTRQIRENLPGAEIGDPAEDTDKGTEGIETGRTWRDRNTGAA